MAEEKTFMIKEKTAAKLYSEYIKNVLTLYSFLILPGPR